METNTERVKKEFQMAVNKLDSKTKSAIGPLNEKKDGINFKDWKKSIINSLIFLDNDYDLGMPGGDKEKQIFKDDVINLIGECLNYKCVSKVLKKIFKNNEILNNIIEKAYENYITKGLNKKTKDESTTASSSGQYAGPLFGGQPKFKSNVNIKREEIEEIVKESMGFDETTSSSSSGQYVGTAMWAKNRDNWRGKIKTWKGGKFVSVKEKCKKYPYCNQSPEAITLTDVPLDKLDHVFERLSKKTNKPYSVIKRIFFDHFNIK